MGMTQDLGEGIRDTQGLIIGFDKIVETLPQENWKSKENLRLVLEYVKACRLGTAKSGKTNKRIQKTTLYRVIGILRLASEEWIKKDFDKCTKADWDSFYERMETGKIQTEQGTEYKRSSKSKNYKTLRKFLKWRYGHNIDVPDFCSDWVVAEGAPAKVGIAITKTEFDLLIQQARLTTKNQCAITILFDGGLRISEFLQLRWVDLKLLEGKGIYQAHLRRETVKGKKNERYVTLPFSTSAIDSLKNKLIRDRTFNEQNFIFPNTKRALVSSIEAVSKKYLGKRLTPHDLRHSSITYYSDVIANITKLCYRYWGVPFSKEVNRYVKKRHDDIIDDVETFEVGKVKRDLDKQRLRNDSLQSELDTMKSNIQNFEVWKQEAETVMEKMAHDLVQAVDGKYEAPQHIKERVRKKIDQDNDDSK